MFKELVYLHSYPFHPLQLLLEYSFSNVLGGARVWAVSDVGVDKGGVVTRSVQGFSPCNV